MQAIPLTEDLKTLRDFIILKMQQTFILLKTARKACDWVTLAKLTLSRLILFNKRRRAEVKDLKVADYQSRPDWKKEQRGNVKWLCHLLIKFWPTGKFFLPYTLHLAYQKKVWYSLIGKILNGM